MATSVRRRQSATLADGGRTLVGRTRRHTHTHEEHEYAEGEGGETVRESCRKEGGGDVQLDRQDRLGRGGGCPEGGEVGRLAHRREKMVGRIPPEYMAVLGGHVLTVQPFLLLRIELGEGGKGGVNGRRRLRRQGCIGGGFRRLFECGCRGGLGFSKSRPFFSNGREG